MKKRKIRIFAWLLVLVLVLPAAFACQKKDNEGTPGGDGTGNTVSTTDPGDTGDEEVKNLPAEFNYGGKDFIMLTETNSLYFSLYKWEESSYPEEIIDVALYLRQEMMKSKYGVNLVLLNEGTEAYNKFSVATEGGDYLCDIAMLQATRSMTAARNGYFFNVNELNELRLDASYWDQRIQKEYAVGNRLYHLEGDFNYIDDMRTYVVAYNDTLYDELGYYETYGTPYDLVDGGKWTFEVMMNMVKDLAEDSTPDNVMNEKDTWGIVSEASAPYYFMLGSGKQFVSNNNGVLTYNGDDGTMWETLYNALEKTMELGKSPDVLMANRPGSVSASDVWTAASNVFFNDRALFRHTSLSAVTRLLDMKSNYGLLPIPALVEGQEGYYCWVSPYNHYPMAFPITTKDAHTAAQIVETLSYHSRYGADSLYEAFFDHLAYARLCRTVNDRNMLKIVFANKTYDIDTAANLASTEMVTTDIVKNGTYTTLSSGLRSKKDTAKTTIQNFVLDITNHYIAVP